MSIDEETGAIGCALLCVLTLCALTLIPYSCGDSDGKRHTQTQIEYVLKHHSQTTETLTRGLQMILSDQDPQAIDATVSKWGVKP